MVYENVGNLPADYNFVPRKARPEGLVSTPDLVLKLYSMYTAEEPIRKPAVAQATEFLAERIRKREIEPRIGIGFAILSSDTLNVGVWDEKIPHVLKSKLYGFDKGNVNSAKQLDIREYGPFCAFELGIVAVERQAWKEYLRSNHTTLDKMAYLGKTRPGIA